MIVGKDFYCSGLPEPYTPLADKLFDLGEEFHAELFHIWSYDIRQLEYYEELKKLLNKVSVELDNVIGGLKGEAK